jgi:hypothetical protein
MNEAGRGLSVIVVWIPMMPADNAAAALVASRMFGDQVVQFFDDARHAGRAIATSIGAPDEIAWDMYLTYAPDADWLAGAPAPVAFAHQLPGVWADPARFFTGDALRHELAAMVRSLG